MHTVDLLNEAIAVAHTAGIQIREDWLGGDGGVCELRGRLVVFLDANQNSGERLSLVLEALQRSPSLPRISCSPHLRRLLQVRRSA